MEDVREEVKTTLEMKKEYQEARQEEIKKYYSELTEFCKERNIDLGAQLVAGEGGNQVQIFIIDRQ
jgi:hypothetical protein